jgi:hypothetical protein
MNPIDGKLLERFVDLAAQRLEGTWVIIGGAVFPLLGIPYRVTLDIDIAGPLDAPVSATVRLMEIAEELALPVEAVNQAATLFLTRVAGWERHLVRVRQGARASICRPDATLFILLKISRFTETDRDDCLQFLRLASEKGEPVDFPALEKAVTFEMGRGKNAERRRRLKAFLAAIRRRRG